MTRFIVFILLVLVVVEGGAGGKMVELELVGWETAADLVTCLLW